MKYDFYCLAVEPGPPTYQSLNPQHQTTQQLPYPQDDNVPQMGQQVVTMQPTPYVVRRSIGFMQRLEY